MAAKWFHFTNCFNEECRSRIGEKGDKYYYRDTLHKGKRAHIEVFDKKGKHLGEANPLTGKLLENSADKSKKLKIK